MHPIHYIVVSSELSTRDRLRESAPPQAVVETKSKKKANAMQMFANIQTHKDTITVSFITRPTNREDVTVEEKLFAKGVVESLVKDPNTPQLSNMRADGK